MPRLVIVVDEFAAMLAEHPDLHAVFTDVARARTSARHAPGARHPAGLGGGAGRAPRQLPAAGEPPGDGCRRQSRSDRHRRRGTARGRSGLAGSRLRAQGRGRTPPPAAGGALRAPRTSTPSSPCGRASHGLAGRGFRHCRPGLRLDRADAGARGRVVLGLADDPGRQHQDVVAIDPRARSRAGHRGRAGVGKDGHHPADRGQRRAPSWCRATPSRVGCSHAGAVRGHRAARGRRGCADGAPSAGARPCWRERLETLARDTAHTGTSWSDRSARDRGLSRVAELLPGRAVLGLPSRADHLAAGGEAESFQPWRPPGRGSFGGREVQFALASGGELRAAPSARGSTDLAAHDGHDGRGHPRGVQRRRPARGGLGRPRRSRSGRSRRVSGSAIWSAKPGTPRWW